MRECVRCKRPIAPASTPKWALAGRHLHHGRGLCGRCHGYARFKGTLNAYPIARQFSRLDPADCPICEEVHAMREWATARQICEALHMTAEAVEKHLLRHSPHLRDVIAPAARQERRERKRARAA